MRSSPRHPILGTDGLGDRPDGPFGLLGVPPPQSTTLLKVGLLVGLVELTLYNAYQYASWIPRGLAWNDFRLFYAAATIGLRHGWSHIYDPDLQRAAVQAAWPAGPEVRWFPFVNPPPVAWLMAPLTTLPAPVAYVPWVGLVFACLVAAALLLAPRDLLTRGIYLGLALGFLPTFVAIAYGQLGPLVAVSLAGSWLFLRRRREVAAGLLLSTIALKPQLALLVPLALLAAGYRRAFLAAAAAGAALTALSLASLGMHGLSNYRLLAGSLFTDAYFQRWSLTPLVGDGWPWVVAVLVVAIATLLVARAHRGDAGSAIALGVAGSLLTNHYLTASDFTILLVPVWLMLRRPQPAWVLAVLAAGWLAGWFSLAFGWPVVVFEVTLVVSLAVTSRGTPAPAPSALAPAPP